MRRPAMTTWRWLAAGALAVVAVIAADALRTDREAAIVAPPLDPQSLRPGFGPASYSEALRAVAASIEDRRADLVRHPGEWLRMEVLATALTQRFRLTGEPSDLAEADRLLDAALAVAPWPAGPALTRAEVSLLQHDLAGAERALARLDDSALPPSAQEQAAARSMRCEIAFERGDLPQARELCLGGEDVASRLRYANIAAKSGDIAQAIGIVEAQLRGPRLAPQALATIALQRAALALAQGDWESSGEWARAADRAFPGYWLAETFVAQQFALEGNSAEALGRYEDLAERTRDPDVLDALARLASANGQAGRAGERTAQAGAIWEQRARLLPLAYAGHHAEHLSLSGDSSRAVALAGQDYRRRPHPATIVHYGYVLWRGGEPARALEVVRGGEARGFRTAEMKLVEAISLGALGRAAEAGEALAAARRLNPRIDSARQQFVAFGRD